MEVRRATSFSALKNSTQPRTIRPSLRLSAKTSQTTSTTDQYRNKELITAPLDRIEQVFVPRDRLVWLQNLPKPRQAPADGA